jgi:hypothetical protein
MQRLLAAVLIVLPTTIAYAQDVPSAARMDMWCGTAFEVMTRDAPGDAGPEKLAAAKDYADGGQRLIDRAIPIFLESGYSDEALAAYRENLDRQISRSINTGSGRPEFSFQDCSALIGQ